MPIANLALCFRLAERLLERESINLPEIMEILGDRPYPLKDSIKEYLQELEKRKQEEEETAYKPEEDAAEPDHAAAAEDKDEESANEESKKEDEKKKDE